MHRSNCCIISQLEQHPMRCSISSTIPLHRRQLFFRLDPWNSYNHHMFKCHFIIIHISHHHTSDVVEDVDFRCLTVREILERLKYADCEIFQQIADPFLQAPDVILLESHLGQACVVSNHNIFLYLLQESGLFSHFDHFYRKYHLQTLPLGHSHSKFLDLQSFNFTGICVLYISCNFFRWTGLNPTSRIDDVVSERVVSK